MSPRKTEAGSKTLIPPQLLNDIFQLVLDRKFSEAERSLEDIESKMKKSNYNEFKWGYLQALKGIILMVRSNDQGAVLNTLDPNDIHALKRYYKEFSDNARNKIHGDYDRGYFSALSEYMLFLLKQSHLKQKDERRSFVKDHME